jgi:hypothetical protein
MKRIHQEQYLLKITFVLLAKTKWHQIENFGPEMQPPYSDHTSHQEKAV